MSSLPFSLRTNTAEGPPDPSSCGGSTGGDPCVYRYQLPVPGPGGVSPSYTPSLNDMQAQPPCFEIPE